MRRSAFEMDMVILEKCTTARRITEMMMLLRLNYGLCCKQADRLVSKELLTVALVPSKGRAGCRNLLLSNNPRKIIRKVWKTSARGLQVVECWKKLKELYKYEEGLRG